MRPQRLVSWAGQQQVREPRPLGDPECADVDVGQACIPWAGRHRSEPHWMDGSGQRCRQRRPCSLVLQCPRPVTLHPPLDSLEFCSLRQHKTVI